MILRSGGQKGFNKHEAGEGEPSIALFENVDKHHNNEQFISEAFDLLHEGRKRQE